MPAMKPALELNATHPLVAKLKDTADEALFGELTQLLYEQAVLAEGGQLEDPAAFVKRLNALILGNSAVGSRIILGS
jgi:molecular chaperone HtpG